MIRRIIEAALANRLLVALATALVIAAGIWAVRTIPLDAIPDLSDVQVIVFTEYPGQSPQVVEDQVTYPLTTAMLSVPGARTVRGYSFFGLSFVYVIFDDGTDLYWARSRVLESLNFVSGRLPDDVHPTLGPDATGVGWIYEYALVDKSGKHDLASLRSIQDWYLRYPLQTVPGVAEVASIGGYVKQYQVVVDPDALARYHIPLARVRMAIANANQDVGGKLIEMGETEYMVRGRGYARSLDDFRAIPVSASDDGVPIRLGDIATVRLGPELRRGVAELDGTGEVAGGVIVMRSGENALATIRGVAQKLNELKAGLPDGVQIVTTYDRSNLIERAIATLNQKLLEEFVVVSLVCVLFLLHFRSALVAIVALPVGVLMSFIAMRYFGINANIMSLGGIAITVGAMVDGAIVMIENAHKHLEHDTAKNGAPLTSTQRWRSIGAAATEVGPALFFSLLIITVSYVVIFTLTGQEGRLFSPLAFTSTFSMAAAALLAITLVPLLMGFFIRGRILSEARNPVNRGLHRLHAPALHQAIRFSRSAVIIALVLVAASWYPLSRLGSEFMPPLDEGDILYMPTTFPGISITKAKELLAQTDRILRTFPEVQSVFGKVGRAETATDPAPLSMLETIVRLKDRSGWPDPTKSTRTLMDEMDKAIHFPGLSNAWTMPIKTRIDMLSTGIKTPVGIKVSGPNLRVLQDLSTRIELAMKTMPETLSAFGDRAVGGYFVDYDIDREAAARYGLSVAEIGRTIMTAVGGMNITHTVEGLERYPVNLRYPRDLRDNPRGLGQVLVTTATGAQIPLSQVARITLTRGAPVIKSENARPSAWVYVDLKTDDVGGFVRQAKRVLAQKVKLPAGYDLVWSGQFEYMERAAARLKIMIPATLLLIFVLLYLNFRNVTAPLVVMMSIPFSLIGGIWLIYALGFNLSVAVAVGFIALAGVATEIGVLILTFIDQAIARAREETGDKLNRQQVFAAVQQGTSDRVRPIVMTAAAIVAGLAPIMVGSGTGSQITLRIAAPMIGGMVTTTVLSLIVLPVIYGWVLVTRERFRAP